MKIQGLSLRHCVCIKKLLISRSDFSFLVPFHPPRSSPAKSVKSVGLSRSTPAKSTGLQHNLHPPVIPVHIAYKAEQRHLESRLHEIARAGR